MVARLALALELPWNCLAVQRGTGGLAQK